MTSTRKKARENTVIALLMALFSSLVCAGLITLAVVTHNTADEQTRAWNAPTIAQDPNPHAPVTCNGAPMSPDQICDHVITQGNGQQITIHYGYEEQKQYQANLRTQQETDRLTTQHNKLKPPFETTLTGCLSGFLWLLGGITGLFALVCFISFVANLLSILGPSRQPIPSEPEESAQNHLDESK